MSAVAAIRAEFQRWIERQDELAKQALMLSAQATLESISVDQVSELMAICFTAGTISGVRAQIESERDVLFNEIDGVPH